MKYMLLIHSGGTAWARFNSLGEEEQARIIGEYLAISEAPGVLGGHQLHPADTATTVRVQDGRTLTTDGPFIEAKEALGGYYIYEADDLDAALRLAGRPDPGRSDGRRDRGASGYGALGRSSNRSSATSGGVCSPL